MTIVTRPLMTLAVDVAASVSIDAGQHGRRAIPIVGGTVAGVYTGKVLAGGADWQTIWPDGRLELEAHYVLDIDGYGLVEVSSSGVRHGPPDVLAALARGEAVEPNLYYFRTSMRFRTAAPGLLHLNAVIALSKGRRDKSTVHLEVFEVL
jgi:Protein of unknown function (DUF3237)